MWNPTRQLWRYWDKYYVRFLPNQKCILSALLFALIWVNRFQNRPDVYLKSASCAIAGTILVNFSRLFFYVAAQFEYSLETAKLQLFSSLSHERSSSWDTAGAPTGQCGCSVPVPPLDPSIKAGVAVRVQAADMCAETSIWYSQFLSTLSQCHVEIEYILSQNSYTYN